MPRTESESLDDEEILMFPIVDVGLDETTEDTEDNKEQFVSLRQRRQIKLGIRKVGLRFWFLDPFSQNSLFNNIILQ